MSSIWRSIQNVFASGIELIHDLYEPLFGDAAWGWAIITLTLVVRVAMLPLARKQFTSMRAMQELSPQVKKIQKKYKTDRDLMKKDPERYQSMKAKQNEELQALYREHGVNPVAGCLPLIAQAPIFLALFSVLRSQDILDGRIVTAPFYFITENAAAVDGFDMPGLGSTADSAGWPGYALILLMAATMFFTQRQTMARTAATRAAKGTEDDSGPADMAAQQQKILMYVMPVFLAVISRSFPLGVLLYWVTTNFWQVAQQALILREVKETSVVPGPSDGKGGRASGKRPINDGPSDSGTAKKTPRTPKSPGKPRDERPSNRSNGSPKKKKGGSSHLPAQSDARRKGSHLPSRKTP